MGEGHGIGLPPVGVIGGAAGKRNGCELGEHAHIDGTFEIDDLTHGLPVVCPPPAVELGLASLREIEAHVALGNGEPQEKPTLLLTDARGTPTAAYVTLRQPVRDPVRRGRGQCDVAAFESDLLVQLSIQGLFDRFALTHASLRKLPSPAARPLPEEYLAVVAHQDDADIGAI